MIRHRAVLFGLLGAVLIAAAFLPSLRLAATIGGLVSTLAFVALVQLAGELEPQIRTAMFIDIVLSAALFVALGLQIATRIAD